MPKQQCNAIKRFQVYSTLNGAYVRVFLEEANVEVDTRDELGDTPLIAVYDQPEIVHYLLEKGADPTIRTRGDDDPVTMPTSKYTDPNVLECAAGSGNTDVGGLESLKFLLGRGEYPMRDKNGASQGELLNSEQKQNVVDATPIAADNGDLESLKLLLSYQFPNDDNDSFIPFEIPEVWHNPFINGIYNAMIFNQLEKFEFLTSFGLKEHESMS
ncbi:hypothetical protein F4782DRAFT_534593 [Xylaria castorea]|nr:hypothetical protein F4782DRAFT_534593 [Xylaria castorea]